MNTTISRGGASSSHGAPPDAIARELSSEGIEVSGETVRTWCQDLEIEKESA